MNYRTLQLLRQILKNIVNQERSAHHIYHVIHPLALHILDVVHEHNEQLNYIPPLRDLKFLQNGGNMDMFLVQYTQYSPLWLDRKSTRLNSSHVAISYAVFCLKK